MCQHACYDSDMVSTFMSLKSGLYDRLGNNTGSPRETMTLDLVVVHVTRLSVFTCDYDKQSGYFQLRQSGHSLSSCKYMPDTCTMSCLVCLLKECYLCIDRQKYTGYNLQSGTNKSHCIVNDIIFSQIKKISWWFVQVYFQGWYSQW